MQITEDVRDYWDKRSEGFSCSVREEAEYRGASEAEKLISNANLRPGSNVLDIGCGPGYFTMILSEYGMDVTGIDYSDEMLVQARKNADSLGVKAKFLKMDASDLEFVDETFDAVVSRNVLWNLERPEQAYREMMRVLIPGGNLVVYDGNFYLYLFDDEYDEARKRRMRIRMDSEQKGSHDKYRGDMDFGIIEELAKDMPLSRELRPAWDMQVLQQLPCSSIEVHLHRSRDMPNGSHNPVVGFEIIATKSDNNVQ